MKKDYQILYAQRKAQNIAVYTGKGGEACVGLFDCHNNRQFPCSVCVKAALHLRLINGEDGKFVTYALPGYCKGKHPELPAATEMDFATRKQVTAYRKACKSKPVHVADPDALVVCSRCGEAKPAREFSPDASHKNGVHSQCRVCVAAARRERYRKSKLNRL